MNGPSMRIPRRRLAALAAALATPALAQAPFPARAVRIIVPFPAGGSNDISARVAAEQLRALWNQPVVVENVSGAGGNIGAAAVARAEPDGHTLLCTPPGPLAINQFLFRNPGYDANAMVPVTVLNKTPNVAIVSVGTGIATAAELIERARARPEGMTFASQGIGTTSHLTGVLFQDLTGTRLTHVPYRGEAPAMADVVGGRVDMIFSNVTGALGHHQSGRVRMLAIADTDRAPEAPEVPKASEIGLPGFLSTAWFGIAAPPGTPAPVAARIAEAVNAVLRLPEVVRRYRELGATVVGGTPEQTLAFVAEERERWGGLVRRTNLSAE